MKNTVIQECAAGGGRIGTTLCNGAEDEEPDRNEKAVSTVTEMGEVTLCMAPEDLKKVSRAEYADFIQ